MLSSKDNMPTNQELKTEDFENFLNSFGAARLLLQRAYKNGSLLEGLVLYAALVDGFCRICLVLKEQVENRTSNINVKFIKQESNETNYSERDIYTMSHNKKIIGDSLFKEINDLYDIRNKAIHRFFIGKVAYTHLEDTLNQYEKVFDALYKITYDLEQEQIDKGIGMTVAGSKLNDKEKAEELNKFINKIKSGR